MQLDKPDLVFGRVLQMNILMSANFVKGQLFFEDHWDSAIACIESLYNVEVTDSSPSRDGRGSL